VTSPASSVLRLARVIAFSAATVVLGALGHLLGSGGPPPPADLLALCLPVGLVCALLGNRPRGLAATWLGLGAIQVGLHAAFGLLGAGLLGAGQHCAGTGWPVEHLGHAGSSLAGSSLAGSSLAACVGDGAAQADAGMAGPPSWIMLAGHLLATWLTALVLRHGERLLERVLQALRAWVPTSTSPAVPATRPARPWAAQTVLAPVVAAGGTCRRGPPA
jgi:hypothetical protein